MWFLLFLLATRPYASSLTPIDYRATTAVGGVLSELDVLLGVHVHHERGRVHHLLTHADVSLLNQLAGVVDRLRQTELEHLRLQSAVHQLGGRQLQNGVQLLVLLGDEAQAGHAADDGSTLEDSAGIRLLQRQQFTSSLDVTPFPFHHLADLGEHELHTPDLTLVAQTVFTANTQLLVQTLALVGATGSAEGKTIYSRR